MKTLKSKVNGEYVTINELSAEVAERTGFNKRDVEEICNAFVQTCKDSINDGITISLTEFLKIKLKHRKARIVRNPRTKEKMMCPEMMMAKAYVVPAFAKTIRDNTELLENYKKEHNID